MSAAGASRPDLVRIDEALRAAMALLREHARRERTFEMKGPNQPVTAADREADALLRAQLLRGDEGWVSEESVDDGVRLGRRRVWVVDPLDGTREFLAGRNEWAVSIGLVEDGVPVAGGIGNPLQDVRIVGGLGLGVTVNDVPVPPPRSVASVGALDVVCSRSEWRRGEWRHWVERGVSARPVGSVAWKLGLVAAGRADASWTFLPKNEWDVAAGFALVRAVGGEAWAVGEPARAFNRAQTRMGGAVVASAPAAGLVRALLAD